MVRGGCGQQVQVFGGWIRVLGQVLGINKIRLK